MTERPTPPTCITCKWVRVTPDTHLVRNEKGDYETKIYGYSHNCTKDVPLYDMVTGKTLDLNRVPRDCYYMRKYRGGDRRQNDAFGGGDCGPEGKLWEPKE